MVIDTYQINSDKLSASEALYGFAGWLTSQSSPVTMSSHHNCSIVADMVKRFCDANKLHDPVDGWDQHLKHPGSVWHP